MKYYRNHIMWEDFHWHQKAAVLNNSSLGNLHKEEKRKITYERELWSGTQEKRRKKKTNDAEHMQSGKVASETRETVSYMELHRSLCSWECDISRLRCDVWIWLPMMSQKIT